MNGEKLTWYKARSLQTNIWSQLDTWPTLASIGPILNQHATSIGPIWSQQGTPSNVEHWPIVLQVKMSRLVLKSINNVKWHLPVNKNVLRIANILAICTTPPPICSPLPPPSYEPNSTSLAPILAELVYLCMLFIFLLICTASTADQRKNKWHWHIS